MKVGKENCREAGGSVKMDLTSHRTSMTRISTAKRSRSFRASAKLIHKFRSHANIRTVVDKFDVKTNLVVRSGESSSNVAEKFFRSTENNVPNDFSKKELSSSVASKETNDLRSIVREVKNKLSLTDRPRRKNLTMEKSSTNQRSIDDHRNRCDFVDKNSTTSYWNSLNLHSYENPTFSLDGSLDSSVSECMYSVEPETLENFRDFRFPSNVEKIVKTSPIIRQPPIQRWTNEHSTIAGNRNFDEFHDRRKIYCNGLSNENKTVESDNLIDDDKREFPRKNYGTTDYLSWIMNRRANFRFAGNTEIGEINCVEDNNGRNVLQPTDGNFTDVPAITKSQSLQGMEFLEGFGKKKQQHGNNQATTMAANINPLTAQPSLNIHVHALFVAVEQGHLEKVRTILESTDVDVNSVNSDGLSTLDVAVLNNNRSLAKMLIAYGAREGNRFASPEALDSHLGCLLSTAELRAQELGAVSTSNGCSVHEGAATSSRAGNTTTNNDRAGNVDDAEDKQLATWERRIRGLRKMLLGFDQSRPPDTNFQVVIDVIGTNSIVLKFQESDVHDSTPICTKYKLQWSTSEDFSCLRGERLLLDMKQRECRIDGLVHGQRYYLRAAAGNIKGWSRFVASTPACVTPSSWRDVDEKPPRYVGRLDQLETLFADVNRSEYNDPTSVPQRRNHKKKTTTIKQLFTATGKFQKSLRRGIYLSCLLYHDDKILVTNEDFLPVIEVDETYSPSFVQNDFHWFTKVGCTWNDVKTLKQDMEKCGQNISSNHLRLKLLQSAGQMQTILGIQDLGQIYYKPLKDVNGTMVISTVNSVKTTKSVSILNGRWLPLNKVIKKLTNHENGNVADMLMSSVQSQMAYHQSCGIKLTRGLYLGYLKMRSTVDLVQVFVPSKSPNVLPHCKIRDNSHVSAEEWHYLKRVMRLQPSEISEKKENPSTQSLQGTEQQKLFVDLISSTSRRLFSYMEINTEDVHSHRLYDAEIIELAAQVSLIVVVPPPETSCSVPGADDVLSQRNDLLLLPIQIFEMINLSSYQKKITNLYSRLSCILELDTVQAQHAHREAFSSSELETTREKLVKLQDLQCRTNAVWKETRWLIDLISYARDRGNSGIATVQNSFPSITNLLSVERTKNSANSHSLKRSLIQRQPKDPKLVKSSPGRGSWPGPNLSSNSTSLSSSASASCNVLTSELSKSEQQLPNKGANGHYAKKSVATEFSTDHRFRGNEKNFERSSLTNKNGSLPLSRSEDSLLLTNYKHSPRNRSVTSLNSVSSTSANHSINPKSAIYSKSHVNATTTAATNNWTVTNVGRTSDAKHSSNRNDDCSLGNSNGSTKSKSGKPTASVAAVAGPIVDNQTVKKKDDSALMPAPLPGILQVFAAYRTGLALGTSLKLHVTPRTTAREVVDLVVKQLNMAVVLKGQEGPIYTADELPNFCLVAVIGARERCLRDDFKPLQLQNPWKKGRLYVRQKHDVLAALEHSTKQIAYV